MTVAKRECRFVLGIITELGAGDEAQPSMTYVCDWLNDNGYAYRVISGVEVSDLDDEDEATLDDAQGATGG